MANLDFHVMIRADCEATGHSIADPGLGERAARGLVEIAEAAGLKTTHLVIPTDLEASPDMYREFDRSGVQVDLHLHPADQGYDEFLGVYGADDQRKIIDEAAERFAQVMGRRPRAMCPGYCSANDHTYPVLAELGFDHGKVSLPTRVLPECASVWAGAPLDMHYAHRHNRVLVGDLDFVEVPSTLDPDSRMWGGKHPLDLRIELVDAKNHWYTIAKAVDRQIAEDTPVKFIQIVTHNTFEYSDAADFRRQTAVKMIEHTKAIIESKGARVIPATMASAAAAYRKVCPIEQASAATLTLDTRGRS